METSNAPVQFFALSERCGQDGCRAKRYYEQDGRTYCRNGHDQGITRSFAQEEEDYVPPSSQGQTTRLQKEHTERRSRYLTGFPALNLFLACYQQLLRHQCWALIRTKKVNADIEPLVRDLWRLRVPHILDTIGARLRSSDEGEETTDDDAVGPKLYSSQGESTAGETTDTDSVPRREKRRELPSLVDSLALCYLGLIFLRAPVSIGELHHWAVSEDVPFIRPLRLIPLEIRRNMSTRWINLFETHHALKPDDLHKSIQRLISQYQRHFSLSLPPLNHPPLLMWYLYQLALPIQLQTTVEHLATLLNVSFHFPLSRSRKSSHQSLPEIVLLALLVTSVKTMHPFPPTPTTYATSETDPAYLALDWSEWSAARAAYKETIRADKPFLPGEQMALTEADAFTLNDEQMDSYMEWFDKTWTEPTREDKKRGQLPQELVDMFPTTHPPSLPPIRPSESTDDEERQRAAMDVRMEAVFSGLRPRQIVSLERASKIRTDTGKIVGRVGAAYQVYVKEEDLSGVVKEFHEEVAERAAISVGRLLKEVRKLEVLLEKMEKRAKARNSAVDEEDTTLRRHL